MHVSHYSHRLHLFLQAWLRGLRHGTRNEMPTFPFQMWRYSVQRASSLLRSERSTTTRLHLITIRGLKPYLNMRWSTTNSETCWSFPAQKAAPERITPREVKHHPRALSWISSGYISFPNLALLSPKGKLSNKQDTIQPQREARRC